MCSIHPGVVLRVLLVDDHALFRQGLSFLLDDLDDSLAFYEAQDCGEALALLSEQPVDLVLLDMNMPGLSGLDALSSLLAAAPATPITVLSGEEDAGLIRRAIDAGASGFVPKTASADILVAALKLILAGGVYLPTSVLAAASSAEVFTPEKDSGLSDRQTAVLLRAIQGQANKVIASELGIAEGTVKTHLSGAFKVLGVRNRTEAVYAAARLGISAPEH